MKKSKELLIKLKQLYWFAIDHDVIIERKNIDKKICGQN